MEIEPMQFGWSVVSEVASWLKDAHAAARNAAQRRIANIVEHAGILVTGVHRINSEALKLIRPLVYFSPDEWDIARRTQLIDQLISFTDQTVVVPQMRTSMSSLHNLLADVSDRDIELPARSILEGVESLFVSPASLRHSEPDSKDTWPDNDAASLLANVQDAYFSDLVVEHVLRELLNLLRLQDFSNHDRNQLQALAAALTASDPDEVSSKPSAVRPQRLQELQSDFGRLIAAQQRIFPGMPRPGWAFV